MAYWTAIAGGNRVRTAGGCLQGNLLLQTCLQRWSFGLAKSESIALGVTKNKNVTLRGVFILLILLDVGTYIRQVQESINYLLHLQNNLSIVILLKLQCSEQSDLGQRH